MTTLTEKEFKETMTGRMIDVTETAEPVIDIWPYIKQLTKDNFVTSYVYEKQLVEKVYRNDQATFDHVLIPTESSNIFIVVIVDLKKREIKGHFRLDLKREYGID